MQNEIKTKTLLLNKRGLLDVKGYSKRMNFIYNRNQVKSFPLKLKEWNFYQFIKDKYVLQLTIGHVSYMCNIAVTLFNIETNERKSVSLMKPFYKPKLDVNPEEESVIEYKNKNNFIVFKTLKNKRILEFKGSNKEYKKVDIYIEIENDINNEKMVIATPFINKKQFYLNYKENYYYVNGYICFDEKKVDFNNSQGLIDWGRGIWPYRHEWYWGNLTSFIDNIPFGFNIGWGFGNLGYATENMFFYNKKAYKLKQLTVQRDENDYLKPWFIKDEEDLFYLEFSPIYNNFTKNEYFVINTKCNQVFGIFKGYIKIENKKIEFANILAFIEHAINRW